MSGFDNYNSESDFEDERPGGNGGGLRKMLEETLAENKKLLDRLNKTERDTSVTGLLKDKGLDPAIAQLIPADADPAQWLEEKAHLFVADGQRPPVDDRKDLDNVQVQQQQVEDIDPAVLLEEQRALEIMSNAQMSGTPATPSSDLMEQLAKFDGSEEDLVKFFQKNGAPNAF